MPFVVADDGIIYSEAEPLTFEGKTYPGFRIAYEAGIGVSPEDEYFIHYDPETYQMVWLGYTVTYKTQKKSKDIRWINYDNWQTFNGLLLPHSMNWHKSEEGKLIPTKRRTFINTEISTSKMAAGFYQKTEKAVFVK